VATNHGSKEERAQALDPELQPFFHALEELLDPDDVLAVSAHALIQAGTGSRSSWMMGSRS
jgi:hypothetical protein